MLIVETDHDVPANGMAHLVKGSLWKCSFVVIY
jgi:hypothetical protein